MNNSEWFYSKDNKANGPVKWSKILELYQSNKLKRSSKVWHQNYPDWIKLKEILDKKPLPPPIPKKVDNTLPGVSTNENPPPLPDKKKSIKVGPIQSKGDFIASQWLTKLSFVVLSLMLMGSLYALIIGGFQDESNTSEKIIQEWPTAFNLGEKTSSYTPAPPSFSQSLIENVSHTFGFKMGQEKAINMIHNRFPSLSRDLSVAEAKFKREFKSAYNSIDKTADMRLSDWSTIKNEIERRSPNIDYSNVKKQDAEEFIEKLQARASGSLPSPVLETLLMFNPKYIQNPRLMFSDGYTKEYRSKNSAKAKGVDLAIEYPASWKADEGRRPNVVQKFTSENGHGLEIVTIVIKNFPREIADKFSESDILKLKEEKIWDAIYPSMNTLDEGSVVIAGRPAIWGEFSGTINQTGIKLDMHGLGFALIDNESMVQIMFMVSQKNDSSNSSIEAKFRHSAQVFQMMINSLDFFDQYEGSSKSTLSNNNLKLLNGKWSGIGYELNNEATWNMEVTFSDKGVFVSYPSLNCSGEWYLKEIKDKWIIYREEISSGISNCMNNGKVKVDVLSDQKIKFKYYPQDSNQLGAEALLTKH